MKWDQYQVKNIKPRKLKKLINQAKKEELDSKLIEIIKALESK